MTVSAQTPINRSTGNGVTTVFPYQFKIISESDIEVTVDDVVKTLNVDYTLSGVGVDAGGNVTMTVAPANATTVVRKRNMALTRTTDYQDQGSLPAETLDQDIDSTVLMIQQLDDQIGRSITIPAGIAGFDTELPDPVASQFLRINSSGDAIEYVSEVTPGALAVSAFIQTMLDDATAAIARATLAAAGSGLATASGLTQSTARILGRITASTGAIEELTAAQVAAFIAATSSAIQPITASVASNALTITLNPTILDFRSATLTSGAVTKRTVSANISVVISSGSTLGTVNAVASRVAVLAIDNAGTVELAAVNLAGGNDLSETGVITTVAEGGAGAADSATVIYSTTARSNVPYRVVGYVESTQATAGTWATAPSTIQGTGGQANTAMSSLGYGQTWQNLVGSRTAGTTYYNNTGKPIMVAITLNASQTTSPVVGGVTLFSGISTQASGRQSITFIVPPGQSYVCGSTFNAWDELR